MPRVGVWAPLALVALVRPGPGTGTRHAGGDACLHSVLAALTIWCPQAHCRAYSLSPSTSFRWCCVGRRQLQSRLLLCLQEAFSQLQQTSSVPVRIERPVW